MGMRLRRAVICCHATDLSPGLFQRLAFCDRRHCFAGALVCSDSGFDLWVHRCSRKSRICSSTAKLCFGLRRHDASSLSERTPDGSLRDSWCSFTLSVLVRHTALANRALAPLFLPLHG